MKSFPYFVLGLLAIWIIAVAIAFVLALVSETVYQHLFDVFVMAFVLVAGMSIMSREIYTLVERLGKYAASGRGQKHR